MTMKEKQEQATTTTTTKQKDEYDLIWFGIHTITMLIG